MLTFGIDSLKNVMFTELQKPAPDTLKLNSMSEQIGQRHGRLKYETYKFYLSIKKVCISEQTAELERAFQPLFKSDGIASPPNHQRIRGLNRK